MQKNEEVEKSWILCAASSVLGCHKLAFPLFFCLQHEGIAVVYVVLWLYNSVDWNLDMHACMFLCVSVVVTQQRAVVGVYCNRQSSTRTNLTELYPWCIWSLFL